MDSPTKKFLIFTGKKEFFTHEAKSFYTFSTNFLRLPNDKTNFEMKIVSYNYQKSKESKEVKFLYF